MSLRILAFVFCALQILNCGKKLPVSMITATSMDSGLPFDILEGKKWRPEPGANFVKLHFYPDEAFSLSQIEVESCNGNFSDPITAYINFDEYSQDLGSGSVASVKFDPPRTARSVTFNFHKNTDLCIAKVNFYDEKGSKMKWKGPKVVDASVKASETAKPNLSYDVMNLFDSRYEYAWASDKKGAGVFLDFDFKETQKISSIKIWNGYQRSDRHCQTNGRLKVATLTGDNGYKETIQVQDIMGPQTIALSKPFEGKKLRLTVDSIYEGKDYKGLVLSEVRFSDGEDWILPNPLEQVQKIAKHNAFQFSAAGANGVLNWSFVGGEYYGNIPTAAVAATEKPQGEESASETTAEDSQQLLASNWTLRLRSDGSMFLEGNTSEDDGSGGKVNKSFFALGNYEVKEAKPDSLKLRIFGLVRKMSAREYQEEYYGGDCNGCGRDCNRSDDPENGEQIFAEHIRLRKSGNKLYVQNENPSKIFQFSVLELVQE
ncbi:discoidin domain-containing protein [Leptospira wolffii]|uniref:Discoidin domain-containing protein n=1 Tax=Leptospira wolffii TaxID=409998 RepID=A0ABV5BLZ7_9LEPT